MDAIDRIKTNAESRLASTHIAGAELGDALRACRKAARSGWQITLSRWENPSDPPKYTVFEYLIAARAIAHDQKGSALAIKFPALGYRTTLLIPLLEFARTAIRIARKAMPQMPAIKLPEEPAALVVAGLYLEPDGIRGEAMIPAAPIKAIIKVMESEPPSDAPKE